MLTPLAPRRFSFLLPALLVAAWLALPQDVACAEPEPNHPTTVARWLNIPDDATPWEINTRLNGHYVLLQMPQDLAKIATFPPDVQQVIWQKIKFRQINLFVLRQVAQVLGDLLGQSKLIQRPEYEQIMKHVILSIASDDASLPNPLFRHEPILASLPAYAKVDLFAPESLAPQLDSRLRQLGLSERVSIHPVPEWSDEGGGAIRHTTTRWAQDLLMPAASSDGHSVALVPFTQNQINDLSRPDNDYLDDLRELKNNHVARIPLFYKFGNILIGEQAGESGKKFLFIGEDEIKYNQRYFYNAFFFMPPRAGIIALYQALSGADEVRVLPNSRHLFHLDMAMTLVDDGVAAMLEPVDPQALTAEDAQVLREIKTELARAGFTIIQIPTTAERVASYQSSVNIVIFNDPKSGRRHALVPEFPDKEIDLNGSEMSLNALIKEAYYLTDMEVNMVAERFYPVHGNTHCAVVALD